MLLFLIALGALGARLDARIDELVKAGRFSGVVLVAHEGKPVYSRAAGFASVAFKVPNDPRTKFNLASNNKMFTAVAVAQLEEQGKLSYGDKAGKFLSAGVSAAVREVTIHQLLTHTSGLGSYFNPRFAAARDRVKAPADFIPFCDEPLQFKPGEGYAYSNCGFIYLGAIIEKVSGQPYDDYVRDHVTGPAGMADTFPYSQEAIVENLATGYTRACELGPQRITPDSPLCTNALWLPRKGSAAGGGYSTAPDMLQFAEAFLGGKLVSPKSLATLTSGKVAMAQPAAPPPPPGVSARYGYGFGDVTRDGLRHFGHTGGAPGMSSVFAVYPQRHVVLVVFSNHDPEEGGGEEIQRALEAALREPG